MRGRLTLAQVFGLFLILLSALLTGFFAFAYRATRRSIIADAAERREAAARRVAKQVQAYLGKGEFAVQNLEQQIRAGSCSVDTLDDAKACLFPALLAAPEVTELAVTHATRQGFDDKGAPLLSPLDHWRLSVSREGEGDDDSLIIRATIRRGAQYFNRTWRVPAGTRWDDSRIEPRNEPAMDPTQWMGFITPASSFARGMTLPTDLSYLEIDSGRPESQRRPGFHVLREIEDGDGRFLGVLRAGLLASHIDERLSSIEVDGDPGHEHKFFIADDQGRLITTTCPADRVAVFGDDLRVSMAKPDPVLAAALALPSLASVNDDQPTANAAFAVAGVPYHATFHYLSGTQDWRVGILAPEDFYLEKPLRLLRSFAFASAGLLALVMIGGGLILRRVRLGLRRVELQAERLHRFDFTPDPSRSRFRDLAAVLDALERAKTALRALGKYSPMALVRQIMESNQEPVLGGALREVSILFSDIEGFTQLSEQLAPDVLAKRLGRYLEVMTTTLQTFEGSVDKYIGDAVMVLWNAPKACEAHALKACRAALACVEATQKLFASPDWDGPPLRTRFGIHLDTVMVGHFGAPDRMSYTALGDGVNLAARLESLNKQYGTRLLVSAAVHARAQGQFAFRRVDRVAVKGKNRAVDVYELLGIAGEYVPTEAVRAYEAAFEVYLRRDFAGALALLEPHLDDGPSRVLHARCRQLLEHPPPPDWDGSRVAAEK